MKKYALKTKIGEVIATTEAYDEFSAKVMFAKRKVLPLTEFLQIFIVEEVKR